MHITWLHDQWITWLSEWDTLTLNHKCYIVRAAELNNENMHVLQIGASLRYKLGQSWCITNWGKRCYKLEQLHYCKLRQVLWQIWGRYYKLGQPSLQNRAAITNWGKMVIYHFINSFGNILIFSKCILLHFLFTDVLLTLFYGVVLSAKFANFV